MATITFTPTLLDTALALDAVAEADGREVLDAAKPPAAWVQLDTAVGAFAGRVKHLLTRRLEAASQEPVVLIKTATAFI